MSNDAQCPQNRAVAVRGLRAIAEAHPARRPDSIAGLAQWLDRTSTADATTNGYVIVVLNDMHAVEAAGAIRRAFEQKKVDQKIMTPSDVAWLSEGDDRPMTEKPSRV